MGELEKELTGIKRQIWCLRQDLETICETCGGGGGGAAEFERVENYAALPPAAAHVDEYYHVLNSQGTAWLPGTLGGTYYSKGFYYSNGVTWVFVGEVPYEATQLTVDAGTVTDQFVSPATLANAAQWNTKVSSVTGPAVDNTDPLNPVITIPTNLTFYSTTAASDIPTYNKLVIDINDPDYDSPAVDVPTGAITGLAQPVGVLASVAGVFAGNPGTINVVTVGEIRRTSGTGVAEFYFEVYQRDSLGTETLVATSNATAPVSAGVYTEFSASCLLNNGNWLSTDRVVIKYYANRLAGGSNPSYEFSFGGTNPVRTLFPISASLLLNVPIAIGVTGITGGTPGNVLSVSPSGLLAQTTVNSGSGANGQVTFWTGTNTQSGDNALYWNNVDKRLGIGTTNTPATLSIVGAGNTSATVSLALRNSTAEQLFSIRDNGSVQIGKNTSGTTQSTASITVTSGDTNTGLALVTKGLGALTVDLPDGTTTGGAARGSNAVDLQGRRSNANQVAGGAYSVIVGGWDNRASATECAVVCGYQNAATTQASFIGSGYFNTASGSNSAIVCGYQNSVSGSNSTIAGGNQNTLSGATAFIGGGNGNSNSGGSGALCGGVGNVVSSFSWQFLGGGYQNSTNGNASTVTGGAFNTITSGSYSTIGGGYGNTIAVDEAVIAGGRNARAYLLGQSANASGHFATQGDAQTSNIRYRNSITGTAKTELFLDGTSVRAILALPTGATNGRLWNAKVQIAAICTTQGNGTVTAGESFIGNYAVGISRIGTTTSLIGTVQNLHTPQTSTNMATAVVDITADDTNEALKLEFTPPTTAGSTTVIRVVATVYLTEVGY